MFFDSDEPLNSFDHLDTITGSGDALIIWTPLKGVGDSTYAHGVLALDWKLDKENQKLTALQIANAKLLVQRLVLKKINPKEISSKDLMS